ncbi:putative Ribosomal protein L18e/L15P domain-containing protein [Seiridium cardinale]|uniref:Ribosomal protein L18e/L15P domain-containing protein n=1 Tax=Seiridium cardinale TaxID=138064 RepID=A0ABR2XD04_9PEZI
MGIDLKDHHVRGTHRKSPKRSYGQQVQPVQFVARVRGCKMLLHRLYMSRTVSSCPRAHPLYGRVKANTRDAQNLPPLSLPPIVQHTAKDEKNTVVIVGTITDDVRLLNVLKLDVAAG